MTTMRSTTIGIREAKAQLRRLESSGWIQPARARMRRIPAPVRVAADAQRALQEDRGA